MLWSGMHLYVHFSPSLSLSMHFCVQNLRTILTVLRRLLRFSCYCSWLHLSHAENSCTLDNRIYTLTFIRERKMDWILNNLTSRENSSNSINLKEGEIYDKLNQINIHRTNAHIKHLSLLTYQKPRKNYRTKLNKL